MRTALIILSGFVLLAVFMGIARALARDRAPAYLAAFGLFSAVWVLLAAANMWVGVTRAGYTFLEELPIFVIIALLPIAVGHVVQKKLRQP